MSSPQLEDVGIHSFLEDPRSLSRLWHERDLQAKLAGGGINYKKKLARENKFTGVGLCHIL